MSDGPLEAGPGREAFPDRWPPKAEADHVVTPLRFRFQPTARLLPPRTLDAAAPLQELAYIEPEADVRIIKALKLPQKRPVLATVFAGSVEDQEHDSHADQKVHYISSSSRLACSGVVTPRSTINFTASRLAC